MPMPTVSGLKVKQYLIHSNIIKIIEVLQHDLQAIFCHRVSTRCYAVLLVVSSWDAIFK